MTTFIKRNVVFEILKFLIISGCFLLLSSCVATTDHGKILSEANKLGLKPAPLPQYQVGTKYVYSNGTWETVSSIGPEGVTWINHRDNESTGLSDFTYKRSQWQTKDRYGKREFKQAEFWLEEATTTLWPLETGNKNRYNEYGRWFTSAGDDRTYDSYWSCTVEGTEQVSVVAGDFDTWKITCKRYPNSFRTTSKTREYRTWYYAPAINHWVLEIRDYNGYRENQRKELAAVLPGLPNFTDQEEDIASIKTLFQNTLESNKKEDSNVWRNAQEKLIVGMTPKNTFKLGNGDVCRQYQQVFSDAGMVYEYPGIACRNDKGRWVVPRR